MTAGKLPDNIIPIDILRIERNQHKKCTCIKPKYTIDVSLREVHCKRCGAKVEPFDALTEIARDIERWNSEIERMLKQRQELADWKPWLIALRRVEKTYRGGKMIPSCPHCGRGILAEELADDCSVYKDRELERRKFERR